MPDLNKCAPSPKFKQSTKKYMIAILSNIWWDYTTHNYGFNDDDETPNDNGTNEETSNDTTNNSSAINFFKSTPGIIVIVFSIIIFIVMMYIGFLKFLKPRHKLPHRNTIKFMATNSLLNVFNPDKGNLDPSLRYLE